MKMLAQGAEATIMLDQDCVVKERVLKAYRIPEIDQKLRGARTRREAKVLEKMRAANIPAPLLKSMDDKKMQITMSFVEGKSLKDVLNENPQGLSCELGKKIGSLHANSIIHGDLTTSNMIVGKEITLIDFGLSFFSSKIEDKAVDLHLLRQALESRHHAIWQDCFAGVIKGYKETGVDAENVIVRLNAVEKRGRNKRKNG